MEKMNFLTHSPAKMTGDNGGRAGQRLEFVWWERPRTAVSFPATPSGGIPPTLGSGGLRGADGAVHAKTGTGTGNAIQSHRIPDSVFRIMRHKGGLAAAGSHPAVFPVALAKAVQTAFSDPGDLIYEPFCGSGTQIIAAERAVRRCFAMELDPAYCDVAVRRRELVTGSKALLQRQYHRNSCVSRYRLVLGLGATLNGKYETAMKGRAILTATQVA